jgi:hypothetical protein
LILIPIFYLVSAFIIVPILNTPFNDDWCYARMTHNFLQTGNIAFINWGEPTLLGHIVWGALFAGVLGWSFTSLHLSTLVLAITAGVVFYLILKFFRVGEFLALCGTALLLFNPIYFINSFTFMTDVPFLALVLVPIYLFLFFFRTKRIYFLLVASILCVFAFTNRQTAIVMPIAFFLFILMTPATRRSTQRTRIFWALVLPIVVDIIVAVWRYSQPNIYSRPFAIPKPIWSIQLAFYILIYVGLFIMPFTVALGVKKSFWHGLRQRISPIIWIAVIAILVAMGIAAGKLMPYLGNQISAYGMFRLNEVMVGERYIMFPFGFWLILTMLSIVSACVLLLAFLFSWQSSHKDILFSNSPWVERIWLLLKDLGNNPTAVVYLITFFFFIFPILIGNAFDRYIILLLPGIILFLARLSEQLSYSRFPLLVGLILTLVFTSSIVCDTLGWHSTAWKEAKLLTASGVPPTKIDAGFSWCGWHHPGLIGAKDQRKDNVYYTSRYLRRFFPKCDNQYCISFSPMRGFDVIKQVSYKTPFWIGGKRLYVLRRNIL